MTKLFRFAILLLAITFSISSFSQVESETETKGFVEPLSINVYNDGCIENYLPMVQRLSPESITFSQFPYINFDGTYINFSENISFQYDKSSCADIKFNNITGRTANRIVQEYDKERNPNMELKVSFLDLGTGQYSDRITIKPEETYIDDKLVVSSLDVNGGIVASSIQLPDGIISSVNSLNRWNKIENALSYTDGFVGIGITTPEEPLHINSNISTQGAGIKLTHFYTDESGDVYASHTIKNYGTQLVFENNINETYLSFNQSGKAFFNSDLYMMNSSKLGVGTSSPQELLHVNGNAIFNGKVGIGASPFSDFKLAVNGKIICEELKVETYDKWADYVFDEDYKLKSIFEVESFIKENKHLPNIPSAEEIEENGFTVGDMNAKLLEKIEELMLYTIEQQKEIEALKVEMNKIKEQN